MSIVVQSMPDATRPEPLYIQLADIMRARIASGFWPAHHKLAAEPELAAQFKVSRGTLRNAIGLLMKEGMLSQVQGRGTFVLPQETPTETVTRSLAGLLRTAQIPFETKQVERAIIEQSDFHKRLIGDGPYLKLVRLRSVQEGPFTVMENVLALPVCGDIPENPRLDEGFYAVLENEVGVPVGRFQRSVTAIGAPADIAPMLDLTPGAPVLRIEQVGYLSDGRPFEYATALIRSDRHSLRMEVGTTGGPA